MWSKEQNEEKSLNLTQFTQHFNSVSFWYVLTVVKCSSGNSLVV